MFNKLSYNNIKEKGFQSKAQVRYLLKMLQLEPEKYAWVRKALKDHGLPEEDGPFRTYWEPPYKISPETPSYKYIGRKAFRKLEQLIARATAEKSPTVGLLKKVAQQWQPHVVHNTAAAKVANQFWTIHGNEIKPGLAPEDIADMFHKFEQFKGYQYLSILTQQEAQRVLGDLIKQRLGENK